MFLYGKVSSNIYIFELLDDSKCITLPLTSIFVALHIPNQRIRTQNNITRSRDHLHLPYHAIHVLSICTFEEWRPLKPRVPVPLAAAGCLTGKGVVF